jgi:2-oxoglutarate dehydrogenase E1 component
VDEKHPVRLSGQDCGRGTFAHRHAVIHDQNREKWDSGVYMPLQNIREGQANFVVIDSLLSEEAVLGFEYGYSTAQPFELVIWEAQFGDFVNGAQVVIDQFIAAGEAKWQRMCGLTMFLPHGYEGQGPEHSSARLERFLQLCAEHNIQVCVPSNAAQFFHMIRRQMVRPMRKPLIVMTPKSLLRLGEAAAPFEALTTGHFQKLLKDPSPTLDAKAVDRVLLCSGKVAFALLHARDAAKDAQLAILRVEQLYPFPEAELTAALAAFPNLKEVLWVQEEPKNAGAWRTLLEPLGHLTAALKSKPTLRYCGRVESASPATGFLKTHEYEQKLLVEEAVSRGNNVR